KSKEQEDDAPDGKSSSKDEPVQKKDGSGRKRKKPLEESGPPEKKNPTTSDYSSQDFSSDAKCPMGRKWNLKMACWNISGIRAWQKKGGMEYLKQEEPDILCLQEVKCSDAKIPPELKNIQGYHSFWNGGLTEGYAGVGLYTKEKPISISYGMGKPKFDQDGRIITAEYDNFYLINVYVPNAGRKLVNLDKRMEWDKEFKAYLKDLEKKKPIILAGDLNVSHKEIDLANPKTNRRNAGFTDEEREGFTNLLKEGFVDTFRHLHADVTGAYTFWTFMGNARARNVGWRLDYFVISESLVSHLCENLIRNQVYGSDHCPIVLLMHF
ncbi:unnamed protein product, partial [Darwinula stevensoni]